MAPGRHSDILSHTPFTFLHSPFNPFRVRRLGQSQCRNSVQPPATKSRAVASPAIRPTSRTVHKSTPERTPFPHNTELYSLSFLSVATPTEVLSRHLSARRILLPFSSAHSSPSELLTVPLKNRHTVSVADRPTDRMKKERKEGRRESFRTATESTHQYLELS